MQLCRKFAVFLRRFPNIRTDVVGLLDEWAARFFEELDYVREGNNGILFAKQMEKDLPQVRHGQVMGNISDSSHFLLLPELAQEVSAAALALEGHVAHLTNDRDACCSWLELSATSSCRLWCQRHTQSSRRGGC